MAKPAQRLDDWRDVRRSQRRENPRIDQSRRLLIGHTDITRPVEGKLAILRRFTDRYPQHCFKGGRHLACAVDQRDRGFRQANLKSAMGFTLEEGIKGHHLLDFNQVHADTRRDRMHRVLTQVSEAPLDRQHDIHKATTIRSELANDFCNCWNDHWALGFQWTRLPQRNRGRNSKIR